jgi:hypothetical protein
LLAKPLREPFTYQAREDIGRAASAKADDQAHRPRRTSARSRSRPIISPASDPA